MAKSLDTQIAERRALVRSKLQPGKRKMLTLVDGRPLDCEIIEQSHEGVFVGAHPDMLFVRYDDVACIGSLRLPASMNTTTDVVKIGGSR
jgi:hypothetical protein